MAGEIEMPSGTVLSVTENQYIPFLHTDNDTGRASWVAGTSDGVKYTLGWFDPKIPPINIDSRFWKYLPDKDGRKFAIIDGILVRATTTTR
jgi:hypothetical protein